ncbi:MAG TPA: hypothetical protein VGS41_05945 [Chthonomonadales bacterium]|nr:hypothetical protein [Chthonomonadales bacterium]
MKRLNLARGAHTLTMASAAIVCCAIPALGQAQYPEGRRPIRVLRPNSEAAVTYVISQFELSYMHRDRLGMSRFLLPTSDNGALQRRLPWFGRPLPEEGNNSSASGQEPAGTPMLFASPRAAFRLRRYGIVKIGPVDSRHWTATVHELGTYADSNGTYRVKRTRMFDVEKSGGKWYIANYYAPGNPDRFGFAIDRSYDSLSPTSGPVSHIGHIQNR